jgi:hypothetical protein
MHRCSRGLPDPRPFTGCQSVELVINIRPRAVLGGRSCRGRRRTLWTIAEREPAPSFGEYMRDRIGNVGSGRKLSLRSVVV